MKRLLLSLLLLPAQGWAQDLLFGQTIHFGPGLPCRILDTRIPFSPPLNGLNTGALRDGEVRRYGTMCGAECLDDRTMRPIPLGARAIVVTVTAVGATAAGHLILYDSTLDDPLSTNYRGTPKISTVNFQRGSAVANTTVVRLGQDQGYNVGEPILPDLAIRARVSDGGSVHVILDVLAFFFDTTATP